MSMIINQIYALQTKAFILISFDDSLFWPLFPV